MRNSLRIALMSFLLSLMSFLRQQSVAAISMRVGYAKTSAALYLCQRWPLEYERVDI